MFLNKKIALLALSASLSFVSCNEYQKALKSTDTKVKYDAAESSYKAGDYRQANRLFEQIAPKYIGKPQGERVLFFFADSYFKIKDYNTAGYQFERFLKSYPNSDKSIEAAFFSAKSYYELSPKYSLDQTDTDKALAKLQNFINAYGESPYIEEANILAKELRVKKEEKAYEIAKQYYKIAVGFDEGAVVLKLGKERPIVSMDSKSGKFIWVRTNEILMASVRGSSKVSVDFVVLCGLNFMS